MLCNGEFEKTFDLKAEYKLCQVPGMFFPARSRYKEGSSMRRTNSGGLSSNCKKAVMYMPLYGDTAGGDYLALTRGSRGTTRVSSLCHESSFWR